jgi:hypothetical protein
VFVLFLACAFLSACVKEETYEACEFPPLQKEECVVKTGDPCSRNEDLCGKESACWVQPTTFIKASGKYEVTVIRPNASEVKQLKSPPCDDKLQFGCFVDEKATAGHCVEINELAVLRKKSTSNCVVEHINCPDGYCIAYHGNSGFCSGECASPDDCPTSKSLCQEFAFDCSAESREEGGGCQQLCVKEGLYDWSNLVLLTE